MVKALVAALILLIAPGALPAGPAEDDIAVRVELRGGLFIIDVDVPLDAFAEETWGTLTDYEHMAQFISGLTYSKVLSRDGNNLRARKRERRGGGSSSFRSRTFATSY